VAGAFVLLMFLVLAGRYYYLQVVEYETYSTLSENNRVHLEAISPPRGFIFDRKGVLLADNQPTFTLTINRQQVDDVDAMIRRLTPVLGLDQDDIKRFYARLRVARKFEDVPVKLRLTDEDIARFSEVKYEMNGANVSVELSRHYPYGDLFAHAIGYVSRISEKEQDELDPVEYAGTNLIGKTGIEKTYESLLHGKVGYQHVETNAHGRLIRVLAKTPPVRGDDLTLFLDYQMQKIAVEQLNGRRGAVVAIDPQTGGVLAFVSNPSFDPNLFVGGIPYAIYKQLSDDIDKPLYNRALQGIYPPGSTIKPFEGMGGLNYGLVTWDTTVVDNGSFHLPGDTHLFRDWKKGGHGVVDLFNAIEQSCDVYFYTLSDRMGVDRFHDWMQQFGFGRKTGIDLVNEASGTLPSVAWKEHRFKAPWYRGEMPSVGIGQGYFTVTPLQLAMATAIMANNGKHIRPHLLQSVKGPHPFDPVNKPDGEVQFNGSPDDWQRMHQAMEAVVHGPRGTATGIARGLVGYTIAGKTGTAQVLGIKQNEKYDESKLNERQYDHAWFIGFAPADNPKIAVAVLVENGRHGGSAAAPIARALFDYEINGIVAPPPKPNTAGANDE
jgi:penicillin-binding protein 2